MASMAFRKEDGYYLVPSSTDKKKKYQVDPDAPSCTCAHFRFRLRGGGECKHIKAVRAALKESQPRLPDDVRAAVLDEIRAGEDDAVALSEKYGEERIDRMIADGDVFEKNGRLHILE